LTRRKFKAKIALPVRKELLIAIIVGFGLGLVIIFGIKTANQAVNKVAPSETTAATETSPTPTVSQAFSLIVNNPEDNAISDKEKIEVSGQTVAGATVAIIFPDGEKIIQADDKGNFSGEITLVGGINQIEITAYDNSDNEATKTVNVVYSTSQI